MNLGDEIHKLQQLHQAGALTDEEFAKAKARLLEEPPVVTDFQGGSPALRAADPAYLEQQTRQWGMLLHLSHFRRLSRTFWRTYCPDPHLAAEERGTSACRCPWQECRELDHQPHYLHRRLHPVDFLDHWHSSPDSGRRTIHRLSHCGGHQSQ
jgi:hypothetical protein